MITAIIQIRLNSSRLKRKALLKIQNLTLIEHLFSQLSYSTQIDKKIIATTTESIDNDIKKLANNIGIQCFRGDSLNVLDRYYNCAKSFDIDTIVRISGDAPLIDPIIVDKTIDLNLGARGLRSVFETILLHDSFLIPSNQSVKKIIMDRNYVMERMSSDMMIKKAS